MELICDFFEKSKNLVKWEEVKLTKIFSVILVFLFFIVTFFPLRTIIVLYLLYKFYRGQTYHSRRVRNNKEVVRLELMNFLEDNKMTHVITDFDLKWEI